MARLEAKLGPSSETLNVIRQEMERDYYSADPRLVDPLLTRCESTLAAVDQQRTREQPPRRTRLVAMNQLFRRTNPHEFVPPRLPRPLLCAELFGRSKSKDTACLA